MEFMATLRLDFFSPVGLLQWSLGLHFVWIFLVMWDCLVCRRLLRMVLKIFSKVFFLNHCFHTFN